MPLANEINIGILCDGVWVYKDQAQTDIALHIKAALGWDLTAFDCWLYGVAHWRGFPKVRQRLMGLRADLCTPCEHAKACRASCENCAIRYFHATRQLALRLENLPTPLRDSMAAVVRESPQFGNLKLSLRSVERIQRQYREMVLSGQKYGAQTALARQYGVSLATIRKLLRPDLDTTR